MQIVKFCLVCGNFPILRQGNSVGKSFFAWLLYRPSSLCASQLGTYDIHEIQSDSTPTILPQFDQVQFTVLIQYIGVAGCFLESVRLPSCLSVMLYINYDGLSNDPEVLYDPTHPQPHRLPLGVPLSCS
jgi:hypothetical protein